MPTASYSQTAWSLAGLFPSADGPEIEAAFTDLSAKVDVFEAERQHLTPAIDPADFRAVVRQLEAIHQMAYRLSSYAGLWFAADTQNQAAQSLRARVDQFMAEVRNRTLFFSLWWKALTDEAAERLLAGDVGDWRY